jgi:hypothetical protein
MSGFSTSRTWDKKPGLVRSNHQRQSRNNEFSHVARAELDREAIDLDVWAEVDCPARQKLGLRALASEERPKNKSAGISDYPPPVWC